MTPRSLVVMAWQQQMLELVLADRLLRCVKAILLQVCGQLGFHVLLFHASSISLTCILVLVANREKLKYLCIFGMQSQTRID